MLVIGKDQRAASNWLAQLYRRALDIILTNADNQQGGGRAGTQPPFLLLRAGGDAAD